MFSLIFILIHVYCQNTYVLFNIVHKSSNNVEKGDVIIKLFDKEVPKTVKNFLYFVEGNGKFKYEGTKFHRIIKNFMIQGGDVVNGDGTGGISIYGQQFDDENFIFKHKKGVISMANRGKNTNGSQFFITTVDTPWLNNNHVVFGEVVKGMDFIEKLQFVETDRLDRPIDNIFINKCEIIYSDDDKGDL
ncbi:Peptidyl-prolyl cis-trans isomerase B [Dictyocoela muelleri]|nr:Peptidyl-prolyl cis-trans isomerase B [Dictyocoela muelleri]